MHKEEINFGKPSLLTCQSTVSETITGRILIQCNLVFKIPNYAQWMRGEKVDEINVSRALKNTYFVNTFYLFIWKIMAQQDKFRTNQFRAKKYPFIYFL